MHAQAWICPMCHDDHPGDMGCLQYAQNQHEMECRNRVALERKLADYEEVLAGYRRVTREIGIAIDGDDAPEQPALIDILAYVKELVAKMAEAEKEIDYLRRYGNKDCTAMADAAREAGEETK